MIDFVKVRILDSDVLFTNLVNGKIKCYSQSNNINIRDVNSINELYGTEFILDECRHLKLKFFKNESIYLEGSLHKFFKGDNNNDFNIDEINQSLVFLEELLFISAKNLKVTQFEFGINILWNDCYSFLDKQFIGNNFKEFNRINNPTKKVMLLKESSITEGLKLKIYCKDHNLLRIEIRVKNASFKVQKNKFCNISLLELSKAEYLGLLKVEFFKNFYKLIIMDIKELGKYPKKITPYYWKSFKDEKDKGEFSDSLYYGKKSSFLKNYLNNEHISSDKFKLRGLIESKFNELLLQN